MVLLLTMKDRYTKWKRTRTIDRVLAVGKRLDELREARAGIDAAMWPQQARIIELDIERLERKRDGYLTYLKNTEAF